MLNNQTPKIDNDFSNLTADSLQQAWHGETKQQHRRLVYRSVAIFLLVIIIGGLSIIIWPIIRQNLADWPIWLKNRSEQVLGGFKEWQANSEKSIIEGNILK